MSDTFTHYVEPTQVVSDGRRSIFVGLGEVGGIQLAYLGVNKEDILLTEPELRSLTAALESCDPEKIDRTSGYYLWRVVITSYPKGATCEPYDGAEYADINPDWKPEDWAPGREWTARFGDRFFWPSTKHEYRSKSSAQARLKLIESFGATARLEQSSLITWPAAVEEVW